MKEENNEIDKVIGKNELSFQDQSFITLFSEFLCQNGMGKNNRTIWKNVFPTVVAKYTLVF